MNKLTLLILLAAACSKSNSKTPDAPVIGEVDAAPDGPAVADCYMGDPQTHDQIINACPGPGVTRIFKNPTLPLMNPDGSLPPLP